MSIIKTRVENLSNNYSEHYYIIYIRTMKIICQKCFEVWDKIAILFNEGFQEIEEEKKMNAKYSNFLGNKMLRSEIIINWSIEMTVAIILIISNEWCDGCSKNK